MRVRISTFCLFALVSQHGDNWGEKGSSMSPATLRHDDITAYDDKMTSPPCHAHSAGEVL